MFPSHSGRVVVGILIAVGALAQPSTRDVRLDLAERRFGLSGLTGGNIRTAVYFDKTWEDVRLECSCPARGIEIQSDGTLIGGNRKELVLLDPQGRRRASFPEPKNTSQIAWNHRTDTLAAIAFDRVTQEWVLEHWPFGSQRFTIVEPFGYTNGNEAFSTISWSPDGSAITYSKTGQIFLYTLADRQAVPIAEGSLPAWSPNGERIAYRDKDGYASVLNPRDRSSRVLIPNVLIRRGVRWSPDSAFALVTVLRPRASFHEETEFLIHRVSDGETTRIDPLVGGTTEDLVFWVVKHR